MQQEPANELQRKSKILQLPSGTSAMEMAVELKTSTEKTEHKNKHNKGLSKCPTCCQFFVKLNLISSAARVKNRRLQTTQATQIHSINFCNKLQGKRCGVHVTELFSINS